ncbi:MAG TPA: ATP-binding cassette domain-containing protein, partial [Armatimonadota bacterium]
MALIHFGNVTKSYIMQEVLKGVTFSVGQGDRTALVGPNGCGKSTLLRILVGQEEPDGGTAAIIGGATVGYLAQENELDRDGTVYQAVLEVRPDLWELQTEVTRLEAEVASLQGAALDVATHAYADAIHHYQDAGGYEADAEVKVILAGLGFAGDELERPVRVLSGGQKTRVCLARLLFQQPHILVLDEPTNHLDLDATEWLERYLQSWNGTLLLVSHDRVFLDAVATEVVDLTGGVAAAYKGNYSQYVAQKELAEAQLQEAYERQQQEIA